MDKNQIAEICVEYGELLRKEGFTPKHREPFSNDYDMNHILWMVNEIPNILDNPDKKEKANRWLGFVQGALSMKGYYTIDEMKGHNRSGKENKGVDPLPKPGDTYYWFEGGFAEQSF